jgi:hypothetical protein
MGADGAKNRFCKRRGKLGKIEYSLSLELAGTTLWGIVHTG